MPGPLDGIRVIDLTTVLLGPWATQIMGDLGADVIKVEAPGGDMTRHIGPSHGGDMGPIFLNCNRNKRSIVLDLKQAPAREALIGLVGTTDVFVHSMRPSAIERLGLGYETLVRVKPDLIYSAAYGYRKDGPYGERAAYDDMIQGASGLAVLQGELVGRPAYMPTVIADKTTALTMVIAVMGAIYHRARTGEGQAIETTMFETMVAATLTEHLFGLTFDPPLGPAGYGRILAPTRRPYRTSDGYVGALPHNDRQWRKFFEIIGRSDMADDPRFATIAARNENYETLYGELERAMKSRTTAAWLAALDEAGIPASPINAPEDLLNDPHLDAVGFWRTIDHPSEGRIRTMDLPSRFSKSPGAIRRPAPRFGEHTVELLAEAGLDEASADALLKSGGAIQAQSMEG